MIEMRSDYYTPMRDFLNDFASANNKVSAQRLKELEALFRDSIQIVLDAIGKGAFRPSRA
jgi:hypothetical protein